MCAIFAIFQFQFVIADESHYLKSVDSKRSMAVVPLLQRAGEFFLFFAAATAAAAGVMRLGSMCGRGGWLACVALAVLKKMKHLDAAGYLIS